MNTIIDTALLRYEQTLTFLRSQDNPWRQTIERRLYTLTIYDYLMRYIDVDPLPIGQKKPYDPRNIGWTLETFLESIRLLIEEICRSFEIIEKGILRHEQRWFRECRALPPEIDEELYHLEFNLFLSEKRFPIYLSFFDSFF